MSLSWLPTWWNTRRRRNDTKVIENTSPNSRHRQTVNMKHKAEIRKMTISIASAKVGSIAVRGLLNVVKAQAGASTTAQVTTCAFEYMSKCINRMAKLAAWEARRVRDVAEGAQNPTQTGLPILINLRPVAAAVSLDAHKLSVYFHKCIDGKDKTQMTPHEAASYAATMVAMSEVLRAVADVVEAYIASIISPTTISVPCLEKMVFAVAAAAIESARGIADAVIYMENRPPPPYEDRSER